MKAGLFSFFVRSVIVSFWAAVIVLFLFLPAMYRYFIKEKSLTIFTWPLILDAQYLRKFQKETGIKLYISFYESNEELVSKLRATKGRGYDIIIPSDFGIETLIKEGYLKKLDKEKLNFLQDINPVLFNNYYDPELTYSIPYFVAIYGVGIDTDFFKGVTPDASWDLIFDKRVVPTAVSMTSEPREAIMIASQYLFGSIDVLNDKEKLKQVKDLLLKQKKWVDVYTNARVEELLASRSLPVVTALSADIWKVKKEFDNLTFIVPKEGSFVVIDSVAIPQDTDKDDLIYQFINYLYRPEVLKHQMDLFGFCSPLVSVESPIGNFCPKPKEFKKLNFFKNIIPEKQLNDIWISLMAV